MVFSNPDQWSVKHGLYNKDHLPLFNCFAGAQKALTGKKIQTPFIDPQLRTKHNDEGTPNQSPFSFISDGKKSLETQAASMTNANITADELWAEKSTVRNKACVSPPKGSFKYSKSVKLSAWLSKHSSVLKMRRKTKYIYIKNKTHHITSLKHHFHWEGPERNTDVTSFYNIMTFAGWAVFPKTVAKFSVGIQQIHINHSYKNCWLMKT